MKCGKCGSPFLTASHIQMGDFFSSYALITCFECGEKRLWDNGNGQVFVGDVLSAILDDKEEYDKGKMRESKG